MIYSNCYNRSVVKKYLYYYFVDKKFSNIKIS